MVFQYARRLSCCSQKFQLISDPLVSSVQLVGTSKMSSHVSSIYAGIFLWREKSSRWKFMSNLWGLYRISVYRTEHWIGGHWETVYLSTGWWSSGSHMPSSEQLVLRQCIRTLAYGILASYSRYSFQLNPFKFYISRRYWIGF